MEDEVQYKDDDSGRAARTVTTTNMKVSQEIKKDNRVRNT
jgi:hypothetical protein